MSMNKYADHVYVIPEDDRNRQIAAGFVLHHRVQDRRIQIMPPAGGWPMVRKTFRDEYLQTLQNDPLARVVMLVDFDGRIDERRAKFDEAIPDDLKERVFVVGSQHNPETLKKALKLGYEQIGESLADDCDAGTTKLWNHEQLQHNAAEQQRMVQTLRPFLF